MDYHYIAKHSDKDSLNVSYLFVAHTKSYKPIFANRKSIITYFDGKKFLLAMRNEKMEMPKMELALMIQAAKKIAEDQQQRNGAGILSLHLSV